MSGVCETLSWDSDFFGVSIARVSGDRLDPALANQIDAWCRDNRIDCLYFFARPDDPQTTRAAEDNGYRLTDVRVVFERSSGGADIPVCPDSVSEFAPADLQSLKTIARQSHRDTRFYFDQRFTSAQAESLYDRWIENSVNGYAQAVLVSRSGDTATGYVTCHLKDNVGTIGLIAVDQACRGQGHGASLVSAAVKWFTDHGATRVEVATSFRNLPAQRLYQRCSFVSASTQLIYHKWFARS